ncbi:MAG TPA: hypothetical protein VMW76_09410 [Bacteroidales bacterium]|nr:hypothetical protein [Bacteroidales bacterium]
MLYKAFGGLGSTSLNTSLRITETEKYFHKPPLQLPSSITWLLNKGFWERTSR